MPDDDQTADNHDDSSHRPAARNLFADDPELEREMARLAKRRIALIGLATGAAMAIVLALCVLLLALATQSSPTP